MAEEWKQIGMNECDLSDEMEILSSSTKNVITGEEERVEMKNPMLTRLEMDFAVMNEMVEFMSVTNQDLVSELVRKNERKDDVIKELVRENQRKDDVIKGLVGELSLLKESASNINDPKDKIDNSNYIEETEETDLGLVCDLSLLQVSTSSEDKICDSDHIEEPDLFRRRRIRWTVEEEEMLKEGMQKFGHVRNPWKQILEFGSHVFSKERKPENLKDKWMNMRRASTK